MGRQLRRVSLDFDWPLHEVWLGLINPYSKFSIRCKKCDGCGYSQEAKRLKDQWYGYVRFQPSDTGSEPLTPDTPAVRQWCEMQFDRMDEHRWDTGNLTRERFVKREGRRLCAMWNEQWCHHLDADDVAALVEADRLCDLTSTWTKGEGWKKNEPFVMPTPEEVNAWAILRAFGHDATNEWVCVKAKCKRLGVPSECDKCEGHGSKWKSKAHEALHDAWNDIEPPAGDGYQLWETVSEGSPISPVFATPEELASWLVEPGNDTSVTKGMTYEQWMVFICGDGWAPSFVADSKGFRDGVQAMVDPA